MKHQKPISTAVVTMEPEVEPELLYNYILKEMCLYYIFYRVVLNRTKLFLVSIIHHQVFIPQRKHFQILVQCRLCCITYFEDQEVEINYNLVNTGLTYILFLKITRGMLQKTHAVKYLKINAGYNESGETLLNLIF